MTNAAAPLNYFLHSYGPAAKPTMYLGWVFIAIAVAVCIVVGFLLLLAICYKRPDIPFAIIGGAGNGLRWIYIGTGVSTSILFAMGTYALVTLNAVAKPPRPPGLTLTVTAYDWWWKIDYDNNDPALRFVTANEIHIPVGEPVLVKLESADVIHAFWVPMLAGKMQMIPGLTNQQWLQADKEGVYRGECTQYCGVQHAHMAFEVVAQNAPDFKRWQAAQLRVATPNAAVNLRAGAQLFMERCAGCHTVRGTDANGMHAPDLTHLLSRRLIAAGMLPNTSAHLMDWIAHAQQIKPGSRMPSIALSPGDVSALSAYLSTLD